MEIIDCFVGDRAQDMEVALDKLGIPENKRLKCTPCILLCIDECIDKVFRQHESSIGFSKLLTVPSSRFNVASKSTSVLTLALIAFSKPLSPSHAPNSVSLCKEFCVFLEDEKKRTASKVLLVLGIALVLGLICPASFYTGAPPFHPLLLLLITLFPSPLSLHARPHTHGQPDSPFMHPHTRHRLHTHMAHSQA
jgi:hypothetical protein